MVAPRWLDRSQARVWDTYRRLYRELSAVLVPLREALSDRVSEEELDTLAAVFDRLLGNLVQTGTRQVVAEKCVG